MLCHLVDTLIGGFVVDYVDRAVILVCMRAREVRETLIINVNFFVWRICDFTILLMFRKAYIDRAKVGDGDVKGAAW